MKQTIVAPTFVATTTRTTRERNQLDPVEAEEMLTSTGCPLDTHQTLINTAWKNVPVYTSDADLRAACPRLFWNRPVNANNSEF